MRRILRKLEDVSAGRTKRLIITMPPRHYKTSCIQRWIAWHLGSRPDDRFMYLTYGAELAEPKSRMVRDMVAGYRYRMVFPGVELDPGSQAMGYWNLAGRRGGVLATGIGGRITGEGAEYLCIDDPFKDREEADSEIIRQKVWDFYTGVAYTRLQPNPVEGAVVVIHTRWHEDDLIGRLKVASAADPLADQWEELDLPAVDKAGSPLWFKLDVYEHIKRNIGPRDFAALYQQRPVPDEGALFRETDFILADHAPLLNDMVRYWDLALSKDQDGDYTAGALCGLDPEGNLWILDVVRMREEWPEVEQAIITRSLSDGDHTIVAVEDVAHQGAALQALRRKKRFLTVPLIPCKPLGKKDSRYRAAAWAAHARAGKLRLVRAPWNNDFIHECLFFPNGTHDDQVDAVSGAAGRLLFTEGETRYDNSDDKPGINSYRFFEAIEEAEDRRSEPEFGLGTYDPDFAYSTD